LDHEAQCNVEIQKRKSVGRNRPENQLTVLLQKLGWNRQKNFLMYENFIKPPQKKGGGGGLSTKYAYNNEAWKSYNIFQNISSRINKLGRNTMIFTPGR
jgi:hypothetical protein